MSHTGTRLLLLGLCVLGTLTWHGMTHAQSTRDNNGLDKAIRSVEKSTGGRVLSAEKRRINNQPKYRVKVLTPSGHVRIIYLDSK